MLINLPIVMAALALIPAGVPAGTAPAQRERLDALGAVLATGGVALLVLGVVRTDTLGWESPVTWATRPLRSNSCATVGMTWRPA